MEFASPQFLFIATLATEGIFYLLLLGFTLHALFLAYHWFSYGTSKATSLASLAIYLSGGAILFLVLSLNLGAI